MSTPAFRIDKYGTLDVTGVERCECWVEATVKHGPRPWSVHDIPALEASLCAKCREDHDVIVLLDEEDGEP